MLQVTVEHITILIHNSISLSSTQKMKVFFFAWLVHSSVILLFSSYYAVFYIDYRISEVQQETLC